jgi:hypothetical protein
MRRKKHSSQPSRPTAPSHDTPPGAAVRKRGEYFEVAFSRRGQRLATFGTNESEAVQRSWNFWRVGNPSTQFADLLTKALTK